MTSTLSRNSLAGAASLLLGVSACTYGTPPSSAPDGATNKDLRVLLFGTTTAPHESAAAVLWGNERDEARAAEDAGCGPRAETGCSVQSCPSAASEAGAAAARMRPAAGIGPIEVRDAHGRTRIALVPGADGDYGSWHGGPAWDEGEHVAVRALDVDIGVTFPKTRLLVDTKGPLVVPPSEDLRLAWATRDGGVIDVVVGGNPDRRALQCRFDAAEGRAVIPRALLAGLFPTVDAKRRPWVYVAHTTSSAQRVQGRDVHVEAHEAVALADLELR